MLLVTVQYREPRSNLITTRKKKGRVCKEKKKLKIAKSLEKNKTLREVVLFPRRNAKNSENIALKAD